MHNSILYHRALDLKVKYMVYMHNKHNLKKKKATDLYAVNIYILLHVYF